MSALEEVFDGVIISTGLWPPRLQDLSVCDFCLWERQKKSTGTHLALPEER
jgi:hypothetical protein